MTALAEPERDMAAHATSVAMASSSATLLTKSLLHPLDTIKCRFQLTALQQGGRPATPSAGTSGARPNPDSSCWSSAARSGRGTAVGERTSFAGAPTSVRNLSTWQQVRTQFRGRWGLSDLYGGLPPKLLLYVPYQTLYITAYDTTRFFLMEREQAKSGGNAPEAPTASHTVLASIAAELCSCVVRVPMEAMKMWVQSATTANSYEAVKHLARVRRLSMVRMLVLPQTLLHDIPYSVTQWLSYEAFRPWALQEAAVEEGAAHSWSSDWTRFLRTSLVGGGAGMFAAAATAPLDHIRTRALVLGGQQLPPSGGARERSSWSVYRDVVKPLYRESGIRGFYRGGAWRVIWVTSNMMVYFPIFELLRNYM